MGDGRAHPQQVAPGVWLVTTGRGAAGSNVYLVRSDSTWTVVDAAWGHSAEAIRTRARIEAAGSITDVVHPLDLRGTCRGCRTGRRRERGASRSRPAFPLGGLMGAGRLPLNGPGGLSCN